MRPILGAAMDDSFRELVWRTLNAYHSDGGTLDDQQERYVVRDSNGVPNVYNTLLTILWELFPERMAFAFDERPDS